MELKRLEKAIADRWVVIAVMALLGVVAALVFGDIASDNRTSIYEATAAIRFAPPEGGTIADLTEELAEAQDIATRAASDILENDQNSLIVEDLANSRLTFVAQGTTVEEAESKAEELRDAFLDVDPLAGGQAVDALLEEVRLEANRVQAQIDELSPEPTPEEEDLIARHEQLDGRIAEVETRIATLEVERAAALDAATRQNLAEQIQGLTQFRDQLEQEKAALEPIESAELSVDEQLELASLQAQMDALMADYQRLSLRQLGVTGAGSGLDPIVTRDLTPEPIHPVVNAAIGLLGGILIAVLAIVFINRTRRPVWVPEDVPIPLLGTVPARRVSAETMENWYDDAEPGPRKAAIQALRSSVEAQVPSDGATIALTGLGTVPDGVQALASDLASSLASAGTSVLLVDANFDARSPLGKYKSGDASVASVFKMNPTAPEFEAQVRHTVESAHRVRSGLAVLPSGPPPSSSADALAGRQFRHLVTVCQEIYDIVVVVVDDIDTPAAQVALQRLGLGILVLTPGAVTIPAVDGIVRDVERLRISMLGTVFLEKQARLISWRRAETAISGSQEGRVVGTESQPVQSPLSRLQNYPLLDERRATTAHGSLDELASTIGAEQSQEGETDSFSTQLLSAIRDAQPVHAAESVERYLVSQTEDMVLARHGQGRLSSELIVTMSEYGFLSLKPLQGLHTVATWLDHEVSSEIGEDAAVKLTEEIEVALGRGGDPVPIDEWLDQEFFRRHVERSDGEPAVWHIVSPERTLSILVPARRLSSSQLELIQAEVARRARNELERLHAEALARSDTEQVSILEAKIDDTHKFEDTLKSLVAGDGVAGRRNVIWRPDWSKGARPNLAPLQAAGLLPTEVLGSDEMSELLASA